MPHQVTNHNASATIRADIFESPAVRSTNVIGVSTTTLPAFKAVRSMST